MAIKTDEPNMGWSDALLRDNGNGVLIPVPSALRLAVFRFVDDEGPGERALHARAPGHFIGYLRATD